METSSNPIVQKFHEQWKDMRDWVTGPINALSDDEFKLELSPGGNTGVWVLGHLIVCDDDFSLYMGRDELLYPEYVKNFGQGSKPIPVDEYPPVQELKDAWGKVCEKNDMVYGDLKDSELEEYHALVKEPEEDYFKTKFRIITHWQLHEMYHAGQLGVILSIAGKAKY